MNHAEQQWLSLLYGSVPRIHSTTADLRNAWIPPDRLRHDQKLAQARARFGKSFACDPGSTFKFRRDRTCLDDWLDTLREQRAVAQAEVPGLLREQAA